MTLGFVFFHIVLLQWLRKLTDCCAGYGNMFYITYNSNNINNKPRDKKNIHPVVINNHTLPYTKKCKYLGHIINNNLTDDDDIARQKRCIYVQANALTRKFNLCNSSIKTTLFNSYCGSMYVCLWCNLKGITVAYNNSFRILHNISPRCSASHMFATIYVKSFNERIRSLIFSLLGRLEKSDNMLFVNYFHTFIYY